MATLFFSACCERERARASQLPTFESFCAKIGSTNLRPSIAERDPNCTRAPFYSWPLQIRSHSRSDRPSAWRLAVKRPNASPSAQPAASFFRHRRGRLCPRLRRRRRSNRRGRRRQQHRLRRLKSPSLPLPPPPPHRLSKCARSRRRRRRCSRHQNSSNVRINGAVQVENFSTCRPSDDSPRSSSADRRRCRRRAARTTSLAHNSVRILLY